MGLILLTQKKRVLGMTDLKSCDLKSCVNMDASSVWSSSNLSGAPTPSTLSECGDDSDYGLFEDLEDDFNFIKSRAETMATTAKSSSSFKTNTSKSVVYTAQNKNAHISCRLFEMNMEKTSSVSISITGESIVQDSSGLHAEYHVKMVLDSVEHNSWKTLNDFEEIAKACQEFSNKKKSVWQSLSSVLIEKRVYKVSQPSTMFTMTLLAWDNVVHQRFKRNWFKQLSASTLVLESQALQYFLECLFFAIPKIDILIEFMA
mmetsp:Transcript_478/g.537  ORF Transcript_478/g.537 Transcript_478/m.537 type:complete len:260 (+) Transcript_478:262-1041(+)